MNDASNCPSCNIIMQLYAIMQPCNTSDLYDFAGTCVFCGILFYFTNYTAVDFLLPNHDTYTL